MLNDLVVVVNHRASANRRIQFATNQLNLTLAAPEINRCIARGKCVLDPTEWMPEKKKYGLSVDQAEFNALNDVLSTCDSFEMIFYPARFWYFRKR